MHLQGTYSKLGTQIYPWPRKSTLCFSCSFLGRYESGSRIKLAYTRRIIDAIHSGTLLEANYTTTEVFGLDIPTGIEGVPSEILDPENTVRSLSFICSSLKNLFLSLMCIILNCSGQTRTHTRKRS